MKKQTFNSLVDLSEFRASETPERMSFTFLTDASNKDTLTYQQLDQASRKVAGTLQTYGKKGDRVIIFCNPGLAYITAFIGCLYAGMIAVPSYPPKLKTQSEKVKAIFLDSGANLVLVDSYIYSINQTEILEDPFFSTKKWLDVNQINMNPENFYLRPDLKQDDLAFLQYTSGSTSNPKGVMVSHGNLLANLDVINRKFDESENSTGVLWLPPYHDLGLIGGILEPLYGGFPAILFSPFAFMQNPYMWLETISKYHATTSGGPNFAYDLCVQNVTKEQAEALDLSSWVLAFNGAEPIRESTLQQFIEKFGPCGFKKQAIYSCYGLAESTLFVTGVSKTEEPKYCCIDKEELQQNRVVEVDETVGKRLVSNGQPFEEETLLIVNPETGLECNADEIGEIWLKSSSVAMGYWKREDINKETFEAYVNNQGPFLRTGDLGFLKDNELYITGRLKDLIIINGRNYYPQDVETTIELSHSAFIKNSSAAFYVEEDGKEKLVVVAEVSDEYDREKLQELYTNAERAIFEHCELALDTLCLVAEKSMPKTRSNKVQRNRCKELYLLKQWAALGIFQGGTMEETETSSRSDLQELANSVLEQFEEGKADSNESGNLWIQKYLIEAAVQVLKLDITQAEANQPLNQYGFDSLMAVHFAHQIEDNLSVTVPLEVILGGDSIVQLANRIEQELTNTNHEIELIIEDVGPTVEELIEEKAYPLSHNQSSIFFMSQLIQDPSVYHLSFCVRFLSEVNKESVLKAFENMMLNHPMLRTTFHIQDGKPVQIIHKQMQLDIDTVATFASNEEFEQFIREESQKPFDLGQGPLFRVRLMIKEDGSCHMLLTIHHLITDFWSLTILIREFCKEYNNLDGSDLLIDKSGVEESSYLDYIKWQQNKIDGQLELAEYWKQKLSGELPVLNLNTDRPRGKMQTFVGDSVFLKLDSTMLAKILEYCKQTGITVYMFLLAAFELLLYAYTGQNDILVGTLTSGRQSNKFQKTMGYFVNPIVLREQIDGIQTVNDYMNAVRQHVLEGFEHQNYPFDMIVEQLHGVRGLGRTPIFQAMFVYQSSADPEMQELNAFALNESKTTLNVNGMELELEPLGNHSAQYDITLTAATLKEELGLSLNYNSDLFFKDTMERMILNYQVILEELLSKQDQCIGNLKLVHSKEAVLLQQWNNTDMEYEPMTLHSLIETQVEKTPDAIAVCMKEEKLTYLELNERANELAHHLIALGIEQEGPVALCMERSIDMVVGLLGILKAGGYYIPLDPMHPKERLQYIMKNIKEGGKNPILLTKQACLHIFDSYDGLKICMDEAYENTGEELKNNPNCKVDIDSVAYTIYTSGSTGKPKGVQIPHKAVVNFMNSMKKEPGITKDDVLLAVTTVSFDIAALELFLPLICGAKVIIASEEDVLDGSRLIGLLSKYQVTIMQGTPSTYRLLLAAGWSGNPSIKLLCGGEAFPIELAQILTNMAGEVWNMYGPTETTIWSTVDLITAPVEDITIGRPIGNTQIYILNQNQQIVPIGVSGELYIGGDGVSRGYYNLNKLNKEKFMSNPFSQTEGQRIYRTGDLVRYRRDGKIEFLGRLDHQVKIRGFRIETGEIETVLNSCEAIRNSVVVAKPDKAGTNRLIAYYIPEEETVTVSFIRQYLKDALPDYMIPSYFIPLVEFPQTPNGKLDRKKLPEPDMIRPEMDVHYQEPQTKLEQIIADVWKNVLGIAQVGTEDNFFELGGNSLLMVQVQQGLLQALPEKGEKEITIVSLFQYPTVASYATYLVGEQADELNKQGFADTEKTNEKESAKSKDIAIIGMSCYLPKSKNLAEYWNNLVEGNECISFYSEEELIKAGVPEHVYKKEQYVPADGAIEDVECFDANFFDYSPKEAALIDPQQRIFLQEAYHALEDAGCNTDIYDGLIGVYGSTGMNTYLYNNLLTHPELMQEGGGYPLMIASDKDFLATRTSYKLNLRGPSMTIQTACSSSLVAIHSACQALHAGECDIAIAGGVSIRFPHHTGYEYQEGLILSPDGHCRAFDEESNGTVFGNGAGIVVLKPLSEALKDEDAIYAVIKGSAINNDGAMKAGYTAPGLDSQAIVIHKAMSDANVEPDEITYVETHGTGTKIGDPIELAALSKAFGTKKVENQSCAIGSVKTNIGHLDTASGVAGVIKTALSLYHKEIPASLHFHKPNAKFNIEQSPFFVNTETIPWTVPLKRDEAGSITESKFKRYAGVSSFGLGGTNAHVILGEAVSDTNRNSITTRKQYVIALSAKSESALKNNQEALKEYLIANKEEDFPNICYTLGMCRRALPYRSAFVCGSREEAIARLSNSMGQPLLKGVVKDERWDTAFLFPGQGAQYMNMGRELYETEPSFRKDMDEGFTILKELMGEDIKPILYPEKDRSREEGKITHTLYTQPCMFLLEYSLAKLWISFGVTPRVMVGHSLGEYVAACLAGVFTFREALVLVTARAQLINGLPQGSMAAVAMPEEELLNCLLPNVSIAAVNGESLCVISGRDEEVEQQIRLLEERGIVTTKLHTSHAFHSAMLDPILPEFEQVVAGLTLKEPTMPYVSCVTGDWITKEEATSVDYWVKHLRNTVRFYNASQKILQLDHMTYLEVGPGKTLSSLLRRGKDAEGKKHLIWNSLPHPNEDTDADYSIYEVLAKRYVTGSICSWKEFYESGHYQKVRLPGYVFDKRQCLIAPKEREEQLPNNATNTYQVSYVDMTNDKSSSDYQSTTFVSGDVPMKKCEGPTTETEQQLTIIWKMIIGGEQVNVWDNFFELGGTSLMMIQVLSEISKRFDGLALTVKEIYDNPTIKQLGAYIDVVRNVDMKQDVVMNENISKEDSSDEVMMEEGEI